MGFHSSHRLLIYSAVQSYHVEYLRQTDLAKASFYRRKLTGQIDLNLSVLNTLGYLILKLKEGNICIHLYMQETCFK